MEANPVRLIEYFNGEKQNMIPLFQRPYTWNKENWQTFWQDILSQYDADDGGSHFMGAIVSIPATTVPVGVNKHLIIDGQQRLTTLSLFLRALKDVADARTAARIDDYLVNRHLEGSVDYLKLLPTQADRAVFQALILDKELSIDHPMKQAFYYFRRQLNGEDLNGDTIDAERMWRVISSDLQAVMINLGDTDDPYLIFESLNYKGEPLTQADLVRNYVLMRFRHSDERGGEQEAVYREIWQPLEESLDKALTEFLRHYTMKEGENVKVGGIYSAFKKHLATLVQEAGVKKELQAMSRYGRFYEMFLFPDRAPSPRLRDKLAVLRGLEMTTAYPLLLRLFDVHESGQLSEDDLVSCFQLIESFSVRRAVCNVPTNAYNKLFLQWAKNFPSDGHVEWLTAQMLAGTGGRRWPTDEEFRTALLTQPQYPKKSTRHILIALEEQFKHKERIDLTTTTIEHIMPQTLSSGWKHELGQDATTINAELGNTIGNLTLTGYNSEMGNLSFEKKKAQLLTSHIELNRWICEQSSWGRHEIETRSKDIAKRALKIWKRPVPVEVG